MTDMTRREFGWLTLGSSVLSSLTTVQADVPFPLPPNKSTIAGVPLGCNTYSFGRVLDMDAAIAGMASIGFGMAEIHPAQLRMGRGATSPPMGQQEMKAAAQKMRAAGIFVLAYNANIGGTPTDGDLQHHCDIAKALSARMITAVGTIEMMRRLDPIAKKNDLYVGMHNEGAIKSVADFEAAREGLSDYTGYCLDIGHFVANGGDPIAMLEKHHDRIFDMHIKDRKANGGPTVVMGTGDTPIRAVLRLVRDRRWKIPCCIEHEVEATDRVASAKVAFEYCAAILRA